MAMVSDTGVVVSGAGDALTAILEGVMCSTKDSHLGAQKIKKQLERLLIQ